MKLLIIYATSLLVLMGAINSASFMRSASADTFPSGIAGRLTDANGAVIAGARIRIIARSTKRALSVETDSNGEYFADLAPDIYDIEAEAAGFKRAKRKSISVMREARSYVDFVMEVKEEQIPRRVSSDI